MTTIRIPTLLRVHTQGRAEIVARGDTVLALLHDATNQYRGLDDQLFDHGELRRFVNVFVNDEDVRARAGLATTVRDGDVLELLPAIAGG